MKRKKKNILQTFFWYNIFVEIKQNKSCANNIFAQYMYSTIWCNFVPASDVILSVVYTIQYSLLLPPGEPCSPTSVHIDNCIKWPHLRSILGTHQTAQFHYSLHTHKSIPDVLGCSLSNYFSSKLSLLLDAACYLINCCTMYNVPGTLNQECDANCICIRYILYGKKTLNASIKKRDFYNLLAAK